MVSTTLILLASILNLAATQASVSSARKSASAPATVSAAVQDNVIYRRERFVYPTDNRRNPFLSLLTIEDAGPQFEDLDLVGIIFGGSMGSVATLIDRATDKRYRVRLGDAIGNANVIEIQADAVVFTVTSFGVTRSETLRIRKEEEEQG